MAYKRFPQSDNARLSVLRKFLNTAAIVNPVEWPVDGTAHSLALNLLPQFETAIQNAGTELSEQNESIRQYNQQISKLKMYTSHFLQVFNLGVERGDFNASDRAKYGIEITSGQLPPLVTSSNIIEAAGRVISGEAERLLVSGQVPMSNPSSSQVAAELSPVTALEGGKSAAKLEYDASQEALELKRTEANELISELWDQILFSFRRNDPASLRRKAREWGVIYANSPGETPDPAEASLYGRVITPTGTTSTSSLVLPGVTVRIAALNVEATTDEEGNYLLPPQPTGTYDVEFSLSGYQTHIEPGINLNANAARELNVTLLPEG